jgi:hypothetical protein
VKAITLNPQHPNAEATIKTVSRPRVALLKRSEEFQSQKSNKDLSSFCPLTIDGSFPVFSMF